MLMRLFEIATRSVSNWENPACVGKVALALLPRIEPSAGCSRQGLQLGLISECDCMANLVFSSITDQSELSKPLFASLTFVFITRRRTSI